VRWSPKDSRRATKLAVVFRPRRSAAARAVVLRAPAERVGNERSTSRPRDALIVYGEAESCGGRRRRAGFSAGVRRRTDRH
jgi:hypothetical protein